jgi:hypothetical protein
VLYGNPGEDWLDPKLTKLGLYEEGLGWHGFRRFRNSWLRKQRVQEDYRLHWMAHKPEVVGELYSALKEDLPARFAEAELVGYSFVLPAEVVSNVPRKSRRRSNRKVHATGILISRMTETTGV